MVTDPCSGCRGLGFWHAPIGDVATKIYCWCAKGDAARRTDGLLVPGEQAELRLSPDATPGREDHGWISTGGTSGSS